MSSSPTQGRADIALATTVGSLACLVYLRTLLPDVGGPEDTPKFQYLGAVLGTAHPPGYPLHTLLSHAFSHLPFGTIAYRANLLSAVAGAMAVGMAALLARATGSSRSAAAVAALATGFGAAFWHYSVLAEVYTLSAALLLAVMFWLARWSATRRDSHLYLAALCFALALGNHLAVVATAPAIALFLLVTDPGRVLKARTLAVAGAIVMSGFLQYLYVLIRTRQGAHYREATAGTVAELVNVIRATDYKEYVFAFSWAEFLSQRLPEFQALVLAELGAVGLVLTLVGVVVIFVRQWRVAALLTLAFAGIAGLVVNMQGDLRGFLVIPLVLAAPCLAAGVDVIRQPLTRFGKVAAVLVTVLLLIYPAWRLRSNFSANDWRTRTRDARFFRAWFSQLPANAAVVPEDYVADLMMNYLQVESGRTIATAPPHAAAVRDLFNAGTPVYVLDARGAELAARGFDFQPVEIPTQPRDPAEPSATPERHGYRLAGLLQSVPIGDAKWHDVTSVAREAMVSLLVDNYRPFEASVSLYAVAGTPLRPVILEDRIVGPGTPTMEVRQFDREDAKSSAELKRVLDADDGTASMLGFEGRYVVRIDHRVNDEGQFGAWGISFGALPDRVLAFARPDRPHPSRALVTEIQPRRFLADRPSEDVVLGARADRLLGAGWHSPEEDAEGEFRWTSASDAYMLLPLAIVDDIRLTVRSMGRASTSLRLLVNGRELAPCALAGGWQDCSWPLPGDLTRIGTNQLTWRASTVARPAQEGTGTDSRVLGVAIRYVRVAPGR